MNSIEKYISTLKNQLDEAKRENSAKGFDYINRLSNGLELFNPEMYIVNKIIKYLETFDYKAPNYGTWLAQIDPKVLSQWDTMDERIIEHYPDAIINEYEISAELHNNPNAEVIMAELSKITGDSEMINNMKKAKKDVDKIAHKLKVAKRFIENYETKRTIDSTNIDELREQVLAKIINSFNQKIGKLQNKIDNKNLPSFLIPSFQKQIDDIKKQMETTKEQIDAMSFPELQTLAYQEFGIDERFLTIIGYLNLKETSSFVKNKDDKIELLKKMESILEVIEYFKSIKDLPEYSEFVQAFSERLDSMNTLISLREKEINVKYEKKKKFLKRKTEELESSKLDDISYNQYLPIYNEKDHKYSDVASRLFFKPLEKAKLSQDEKYFLIRLFSDTILLLACSKTTEDFNNSFEQKVASIIDRLRHLFGDYNTLISKDQSIPTLEVISKMIEDLESNQDEISCSINGNQYDSGVFLEDQQTYSELLEIINSDDSFIRKRKQI